ncbi:MAG: ATP-dependent protease ATPase subunit HslU [Candidatus Coatesbacteria bacterium]|nr:ATP-dependent protease ATPase subunit HslU [Candidatus Coatesbacteria bacterium]
MEELTPRQIVKELDRYIIGQEDAKRAVAISLRNRWRRQRVDEELRDEIMPKNIIMVGPTGVGKTEIARRLSNIAMSPFIKVEASKFTEVGYVGRDVEGIVRDLMELSVNEVRAEHMDELTRNAEERAEEQILDILLPPPFRTTPPPAEEASVDATPEQVNPSDGEKKSGESIKEILDRIPPGILAPEMTVAMQEGSEAPTSESAAEEAIDQEALDKWAATKEKMRAKFREGQFDDTEIEIEVKESSGAVGLNIFSSPGIEEMGIDLRGLISALPFPTEKRTRKEKVGRAMEILTQQELQRMIDMDSVIRDAIERVEETGIVFLDEIDKIVGSESYGGPDVSREGVQRDILPIVEGTTVHTKYGMVNTDHILFIAAGAFHNCKVSDLIPELQGRFPVKVQLSSLGENEFTRILTEPQNALIRQCKALLASEGFNLEFTEDAIREIARISETVNNQNEDIGARRLHTVIDKLLDEVSFDAPDLEEKKLTVDVAYVRDKLKDLAEIRDLSQFIL